MMSLFVFFTTTMSVSFTLRETQTRMLKFTGLITSFITVLLATSVIHSIETSPGIFFLKKIYLKPDLLLHILQDGFNCFLFLFDFLMGESNGYMDLGGKLLGCNNPHAVPSFKISLLSIYCSAASTPCPASASNISVDLCACN